MAATSHLKSFQALAAALRTGSLKAAGEELSITPAAVGQRIKTLEDYIGIELLARGRGGLKATEPLAAALPHIETAFLELDRAAAVLDLQRVQEIHIAAPSDFVTLWLAPRLASYRAKAPRTLFCINGEGDVPFRMGRADCTIAFAPSGDETAGEPLFRDHVLPICAPENFRRLSGIAAIDRLEGFPLLHLDAYKDDPAVPGWPQWVAARGYSRTAPERGIRFQQIAPALDAVQSAAGVMLCGVAMILERIDDGSIALPFGVASGVRTSNAYRARFAPFAGKPHLQAFRQWLLEAGGATETALTRFVPYPA